MTPPWRMRAAVPPHFHPPTRAFSLPSSSGHPTNRLRAAQREVARVIAEVARGRAPQKDGGGNDNGDRAIPARPSPVRRISRLARYLGAGAPIKFRAVDLLAWEDGLAQSMFGGNFPITKTKLVKRDFAAAEREAMRDAPRGVVIVGARGVGKREAVDAALREYDPNLLLFSSSSRGERRGAKIDSGLTATKKPMATTTRNREGERDEDDDNDDQGEHDGIVRVDHGEFAETIREEVAFCSKNRRDLNFVDPIKYALERCFGSVDSPRADLLIVENFSLTNMVDAMLSRRVFRGIFGRGIGVIITSDRPPDHWYGMGLGREQLRPFIEEIKTRCNVLRVEGNGNERFST